MVATPRVIRAARLPIHCQLSFRSQTPKYEAKLNANSGKNTRNPTEAARPTPKKMLIMVSEVILLKVQVQEQESSLRDEP